MVVPTIRNPNRYRTQQVARPTKSQYHLEPDHAVSYRHVGRRTKGGSGGGYIYRSGAYSNNNGGDGTTSSFFYVLLAIIVFVGVICGMLCNLDNDDGNQNDTRATRNNASQQRRNERRVTRNTTSNNNTTGSRSTAVRENVDMKTFFYFQTVLPDKSNIDPDSLRGEAVDMEHTLCDGDDDSVIENANVAPSKTGKSYFLSSRFFLSTWRRPSAAEECSICLQQYQPGQTICLAKNTSCNHVFHEDCIARWLKDHTRCPICRRVMCSRTP